MSSTTAPATTPAPAAPKQPEPVESTLAVKDIASGQEMPLPMVAEGVIDGRAIAMAGLKVYDPGYRATSVVRSSMTQIDGTAGFLRYRGYPIQNLVDLSFLEVVYLLNHGELPTSTELETFTQRVYKTNVQNEQVIAGVVKALGPTSSPLMAVTCSWAALGATVTEHDPNRIGDAMYFKRNREAANDIIGAALSAMPAMYANIFDSLLPGHSKGSPTAVAFDPTLGFAENFAKLLRLDERSGLPFSEVSKALNTIWILQADHEMTCSTAGLLHAASSLVTPYAALASGSCAAYGALHGGALDVAYAQLVEIGSPANVGPYIERVKRKEVRLFGFGHRLYRVEDPRSVIIRKLLTHLQTLRKAATGAVDPLVEVALALEAAALKDEYFISRKLAPNADFFGALVYHSLGLPGEFALTVASIARTSGGICHWREYITDSDIAIWRPSQVFDKAVTRDDEKAPTSVLYKA